MNGRPLAYIVYNFYAAIELTSCLFFNSFEIIKFF